MSNDPRDPRFEEPVAGVDVLALPRRMHAAMAAVLPVFPPGTGVMVFAFDFGGGGALAYISNGDREGCIDALKEWIAREQQMRG